MEANNPQGQEQGKEAKKVEAKYDRAIRQLTAVMGPEWFKVKRITPGDIPDLIGEMVAEEKKKLYELFKTNYKALVDEKKKLDKTIEEKDREFKQAVLNAKKEFLKKVDQAFSVVSQIDQIEKDYYKTLGEDEDKDTLEDTEDTEK